MTRSILVHRVPEIEPDMIPDFAIAAYTAMRDELMTAVGALDVAAVVLDLDEPDATGVVIKALELKPNLGIVGVTGNRDIESLIAAQRAGCRQIVIRPIDPSDLLMALRQAVSLPDEAPADGQTIAVLGAIGGAGSTTIACHLAVELARLVEGPTALFDLDLEFGGVARAFDLSPRFTFADIANAGAIDACVLERAAVSLPTGVEVFARPPTVLEAHGVDENTTRAILRAARRTYPCVLLDVPRHLDAITGVAIEECNKLVLVLQLTVPSLDNARQIITALGDEGIALDRIEIVVNRYRKNVNSCTVEKVERELRRHVLGVVPSDYQAVRRASDIGKPLAQRNPVRSAIREMAVKLSGKGETSKDKSWLEKIGLGG